MRIILLAILLTGCAEIENWEILQANEFCATHKGIDELHLDAVVVVAVCRDGVRTHLYTSGPSPTF